MGAADAIISTIKEIIQTALISLAIFFFVYIFLVQPHRVKGDSMMPNFLDGELLLTEKISYRFGQPQRGDVIVFRAPGRDVDFIKRVIGLPGESVRIQDGVVYVNGMKLTEPYETQTTLGDETISVPSGQYFVLGDNRGASSDSRSFGTISAGSLRGKVWLVYWPFVKSDKSGGLRIISSINYSVVNTLDNF